MANPVDFFGPDLKAERAEHHIGELDGIFREFVRKNRNALRSKCNARAVRKKVTLGGAFPRHTSTVLGDAIHNLRAALDHAYCILVEANGHTVTRYTSFPIGKDRDSVAGSIKGQTDAKHGPSQTVRDAILNTIQPFEGGNGARLYSLHHLDITDKHALLIPTVTKFRLDGYVMHLKNGGRVNINDMTLGSLGSQVQKDGLLHIGPGVYLEAKENAQATFAIGFDRSQTFQGENIVQTLRDLHMLVTSTLKVLRTA